MGGTSTVNSMGPAVGGINTEVEIDISTDGAQPAACCAEKLHLRIRLAKAGRWKQSAVRLVEKNKCPRRCLWAMSMMSGDSRRYGKLSRATVLRIKNYYACGVQWVQSYLTRHQSTGN